jgi:preprotein translocase subunit SecG
MNIFYYFLTFLLFVDCVILTLLVLLQLPKKEAGAGVAFGGGTTDALFGAGSGNVLTKITKYSAGIFFGLALLMAVVAAHMNKGGGTDALIEELSKKPTTATPLAPQNNSSTPATGLLQTPLISNLPPAQSSSASAAPAKPATAPAATNK